MKRNCYAALITALLLISPSLKGQGCYQSIGSDSCGGTPSKADVWNGCQGTSYSPNQSSYCDSRDGQCGKTSCNVNTVSVTLIISVYSIVHTKDGDMCGTFLYQESYTTPSTCAIASLSGSNCGYCP